MYNFCRIILFSLLISCSNLTHVSRVPANFNLIKSCTNLINQIFQRKKSTLDISRILNKLIKFQLLDQSELLFIKKNIHLIPNSNDKKQILSFIKTGQASDRDIVIIRKYILSKFLLKDSKSELFRQRFLALSHSMPITFGLEIEILLKENKNIVNSYRPKIITERDWNNLSLKSRFIEFQKFIHLNKENPFEPIFIKLTSAHPKMPKTLFLEPHGTMELNDMVFNSIGEMKEFIDYFVGNFGRGAMQGHVAFQNLAKVKGNAGYIVFESDLAQLLSLEKNYQRYLTSSSNIPGKNLVHHSLGPIGEDDRLKFIIFEEAAAKGLIPKESIGSSKTINGPNFRVNHPYPEGFVGFELRQYHKNYEGLLEGLDLLSKNLENKGGLNKFKPFDDVETISKELLTKRIKEYNLSINFDDAELFFISIGEHLEKRIKKYGLTFGGASAETRFFFPLRDWSNHPLVKNIKSKIEKKDVEQRIKNATREYLNEIKNLIQQYEVININDQTVLKLQILSAKWADEVQLSENFLAYRYKNLDSISARGPPRFHYLPNITNQFKNISLKSKSIKKYRFDISQPRSNLDEANYNTFLENTVEIIHQPIEPFGHISLRVGKNIYSFNMVKNTSIKKFTPKEKRTGYAFRLNPEEIKKINEELTLFYTSSKKYNIPPFDAHGGDLEIIKSKIPFLGFRYKSNSKNFANNSFFKGKLIEENGSFLIKAPNGFKYPVHKKNGKYYVKSLTCASSALHVLKRELNLDLGQFLGADSLKDALESGNTKVITDAIINYK